MPDDLEWLTARLVIFIPLLLSLSVHEWAHAWSAWMLGDDTARLQGRLSLNPIVHIDPIGTLLLPLIGFPFGWAKPVPFEPLRFRRRISMRLGALIVAAAGPISNVVLAILAFGGLAALYISQAEFTSSVRALHSLLSTLVLLNVLLALFNLFPIPPLDGSRIVDGIVPDALRPAWSSFCQLGPLLLLAVIVLPTMAGASLLRAPVDGVNRLLVDLQAWLLTL
jgi:Zn-dependent protease